MSGRLKLTGTSRNGSVYSVHSLKRSTDSSSFSRIVKRKWTENAKTAISGEGQQKFFFFFFNKSCCYLQLTSYSQKEERGHQNANTSMLLLQYSPGRKLSEPDPVLSTFYWTDGSSYRFFLPSIHKAILNLHAGRI